MVRYYSILELESADDPEYLGQVSLTTGGGSVEIKKDGKSNKPVKPGQPIPTPWLPIGKEAILPSSVDGSDQFQVAPMVGLYSWPASYQELAELNEKKMVHVFKVTEPTPLEEIDGGRCEMYNPETKNKRARGNFLCGRYIWDDSKVDKRITDGPTTYRTANCVVGYESQTKTHKSYSHGGFSPNEKPPEALRDVVGKECPDTLTEEEKEKIGDGNWVTIKRHPKVYKILTHRSFSPDNVLDIVA